MTPQAILKARFSELADVLGIDLKVRRQTGKFYFTIAGPWNKWDAFIQGSFPRAWVTSAGGDVVYGLPLDDVERVLAESHVEPSWLEHNDSVALRIAQRIREEGAFESLPILADALEEAGCDNAEILNHCRGSSTHREICWVVELLLGPDRKRRRPSGPV